MNWKNVNLEDSYERNQTLLDSYDFETLLLEVSCNIKDSEINEITVMQQALKSMNEKISTAMQILQDNIKNITAQAIKESKN